MSEPAAPQSFTVTSEEELPGVAGRLLQRLGGGKKVAFSGEIGAGKTTLIQAVCRLLGVKEEVTSPSFALVNEYLLPTDSGQAERIRHVDLYRLERPEEAWDIGLEEYLYDEQYCFIEWPELLAPWLPDDCLQVVLEVLPNSGRKIIFL